VDGSHAIGVDLGGTKILAGVVTRSGEILRRHERPTPPESQEAVLAELEAAVAELVDDDVAAIGFGVPSPIDGPNGVVVECVNVRLVDCPLRDLMHTRFGLPVGLELPHPPFRRGSVDVPPCAACSDPRARRWNGEVQ